LCNYTIDVPMFSSILKNTPLRFFDVTLRDGLQSIPKIYSLKEKIDLGIDIVVNKNPGAIEIGSIVSPKIVPQMKDSIELFKEIITTCGTHRNLDVYMLTPNYKSVEIASKNDVCNFSFVTSISNAFQQKNINKDLADTKKELVEMIHRVEEIRDSKIKLYISCVTECPVIGKFDIRIVMNEIMYYYYTHGEQLDEICLSDTCGTLRLHEFQLIIGELQRCNVDFNQFSLHLHQQKDSLVVKNILIYAMKNGISRFDVSYMPEIGGCSVTMENPSGNISYEDIYSCL